MDIKPQFDAFGYMKSSQVKVDDFSVPALRGRAHEVQPYLAEPRPDNVSADQFRWFDNDSSWTWSDSEVEDFLRDMEYNPNGGLCHSGSGGRDVVELGVLDELLGGIYEVDGFLEANNSPTKCEESQSPVLSCSSNVAAVHGSAESSTAAVLGAQCYTDPKNLNQMDSKPSVSRDEDMKCVPANKSRSCFPSWKSLGKRSKRFIRQLSCTKSSGLETPSESSPRRVLRKRRAVPLDIESSDDLYSPSESEDDCRKKRGSKKCKFKRKSQRMWTIDEVCKLVDGVALLGTGRWTEIKKLQFPSSPHRTPMDLRDKWRNLLRTANANHDLKQKKRGNQVVDQEKKKKRKKKKAGLGGLTESLVLRVSELASIHPYPRFAPGGRYRRSKDIDL